MNMQPLGLQSFDIVSHALPCLAVQMQLCTSMSCCLSSCAHSLCKNVPLSSATLCVSRQSLTCAIESHDVSLRDCESVHCSCTAAVTTGNTPRAEGVCGRSSANRQ